MTTLRCPVPAIDVHTHLFPERLQAAVRGALTRMYGWSFGMTTEPEAFAAELRARNVERFCMLPYAHKPGMARSLNAWMAETARTLPGAIGFACVHQDDDVRAVLTEAFDELGLAGVKLHHQVQEVAPEDERLFPLYELMVERDRPLLVHAGRGPTDNGLVGYERFCRVVERYPTLRVCVAHLGAPEHREFVALAPDYPNLYLDTSGSGGAGLAGVDITRALDRILFASDAPNVPFPYDASIARILELALGEDAERMLFRENALRYLGSSIATSSS